jgi:homoserine kinase
MIKIRVPATMANIGPGFDCMGMALGLYNYVEVEETDHGLIVENVGLDHDRLSSDENNMVVRSMRRLFNQVGWEPKGMRVRVTTGIPVSRGLGSSAACIVGGLTAANALSGGKMDTQQLLDLAVEIEGHPDNVAPALMGGIVVSSHDQTGTAFVRFPVPDEIECLTAIPNISLSTREARRVLPKTVPYSDAVYNVGKTALLVAALMQQKYEVLDKALGDRLHQQYRSRLVPSLDFIYQKAQKQDLAAMLISGAGPTLIYLLWPESRPRQNEFLELIRQTPEHWEIKVLRGDNEGVVME